MGPHLIGRSMEICLVCIHNFLRMNAQIFIQTKHMVIFKKLIFTIE